MTIPDRLTEIKQRRAAIDRLLPLTIESDGDYLDGMTAEFDILTTEDGKPWVKVLVRDNEDLAKFIVNAPQDIDFLLAMVTKGVSVASISAEQREIKSLKQSLGLAEAANRSLARILDISPDEPLPPRPKRIPIRPIPNTSGGKFDAKGEVELLQKIIRQLTDYVNELRCDVDTLQGYGRE